MIPVSAEEPASERLPLKALQAWEALGFSLFLHFGMSTFLGEETPAGGQPAGTCALDVNQWISIARDAWTGEPLAPHESLLWRLLRHPAP